MLYLSVCLDLLPLLWWVGGDLQHFLTNQPHQEARAAGRVQWGLRRNVSELGQLRGGLWTLQRHHHIGGKAHPLPVTEGPGPGGRRQKKLGSQ